MASIVIKSSRIILAYNHSLKILAGISRAFSSQPPRKSSDSYVPGPLEPSESTQEPIYKWMDVKRGILGPEDDRFPLPGDTGLASQLDSHHHASVEEIIEDLRTSLRARIMMFDEHDDNMTLINQTEGGVEHKVKKFLDTPDQTQLECSIQQCSPLLISDFKTLFPDLMKKYTDGKEPKMVALTLCQKTQNDMGAWSAKMEEERDQLTEQFIELANRIKIEFNDNGYWCNFVDPSSGHPFHGPYTTDKLFETDERYRKLGFCIDDIGCCKVIVHKTWGSKIFVGTIFTTADVYRSEKLLDFLMNLCPVTENDKR